MNTDLVILMENTTGNGSSKGWQGGKGSFFAECASWSSGSAALQALTPNNTWVPVNAPDGSAVSLGANGIAFFDLGPCQIRVVATTATIYSYAVRY